LSAAYGDGFEAYELAPLRRRDVQDALQRNGINDAEPFFSRVEHLDVSSFAIKPVTLDFLIRTYLRDRDLPANQMDLYEKGCRILCEEANESRKSAGRRGMLSVDDRLTIASRIAAVTQFCSRSAVWIDTEGDAQLEDVQLADILGTEQLRDASLPVSPEVLREVLDTGLFSSRGSKRIGWAHQTYAEFLAARYCISHALPFQQIQSLTFHPSNGGTRLVPQLYDVAAWIAIVNPDLLAAVADADPESLLGAAGASLSENQRQVVVQSLLDLSDKGRLLSLRWKLFQLYSKLSHPKLGEQLRPSLLDGSKSAETKQVVLDIARACRVEELGPETAAIALDLSQPKHLRVAAGATVVEAGSKEIKSRLRPLALGDAGEDPDDELKGIGLQALWPESITSKELFPLLTKPKDWHLHGAYASFLYSLSRSLAVTDLPTALRWFTEQRERDIGPIDHLMDDIIHLSIKNVDAQEVLDALVEAILSRVHSNENLMSGFDEGEFFQKIRADHGLRQKLLSKLIPRIEKEEELFWLDYAGVPLLPDIDLVWLIDRLITKSDARSRKYEIELIYRAVDTRLQDHMELLWSACEAHPDLKEVCKDRFFIPLDSEAARILRQNLAYQNKREPKLLDPPPDFRVEQDLMKFEKGNVLEWVNLIRDLSLTPTSTDYGDWFRPDITLLPGWQSPSDDIRSRIILAAIRYLNDADPENDKWFGTSQIYLSAVGGFQALALLIVASPEALASLSNPSWKKWVPIITKYPSDEKIELQYELLKLAYSRVPGEVIARLMQVVDFENNQNGYLFVGPKIDVCWDDRLAGVLLEKAKGTHLKPPVFQALLRSLLAHDASGSYELAKSFVIVPPPTLQAERDAMLAAMEALLSGGRDAGWNEVWPVVRDYPDVGHFLVESISYKHGESERFPERLTEEQLGDFCIWLFTNYPPSPNDHRVSGAIGPAQTVLMFRDQVLQQLKNRANFAACDALREMMAILPQYGWLGLYLEEAELLARAATWQPVSPAQFLALARDSQSRLIESSSQLLAVVFDSLDRLQQKLKDELPASIDLWNSEKGQYWPKDEEELSGYVARHLREDIQHRGIIVNREVQIRRGIGDGTGQVTDIHVDAVAPGKKAGTYARLYVIIEAKGNWNQELFTAMETQLRDRYLRDNRCQNGVYLVGWFSCAKWKEDDSRKKRASRMSIVDARELLSRQGAALSNEGIGIRSHVLDLALS